MSLRDDPTRMDLHELHAAYANGRLEPVEVLRAHLDRLHTVGQRLRCVITPLDAMAWAQAQASAERWRAGRPLGWLDGIPVGLKDNIAVAGVRCTAGTAALDDEIPERDATVVTRLREAGAVLIAKLNLHEAALGATTANPFHGDCLNPLREGYTPGGSSGGSAAAVAAGLCTVALGTDTMGSVRIPAAYCGLFGYKPALGEVPLDGVIPLSPTLDTCGPLARSARDARVVAAVLAGRESLPSDVPRRSADALAFLQLQGEAESPRSRRAGPQAVPSPDTVDSVAETLFEVLAHLQPAHGRPLRVGLPTQWAEVPLQPPVAAAWQAVQQALSRAGIDLVSVEVPAWEPVALRRAALLLSEIEGQAWWSQRLGEDLPGLSEGLKALLRFPQTLGADRRERAVATVGRVREMAPRVFDQVDLLLTPTTPQTAFPHGAPVPVDQADFTTLANAMGAAALSVPVKSPVAPDALPVGCQLMGPALCPWAVSASGRGSGATDRIPYDR